MSEKYKVRDQERPYFITFATIEWIDVFTRAQYKDIIVESLKHCQQQKGMILYAWCLMTNHIHLIVGKGGDENVESIIRDFKKYTSVMVVRAIESNDAESRKQWLLRMFSGAANDSKKHQKYKFWQDSYHPVELSTNTLMDQKLDYVHNNPVKEGIVDKSEEYCYSSARNYCGLPGLLEVAFID